MLDLKAISKMNVQEWSSYIATLESSDIVVNQNLLNVAHGFILCKELMKYNLTDEQISDIFYASLLNNTINTFEEKYKQS